MKKNYLRSSHYSEKKMSKQLLILSFVLSLNSLIAQNNYIQTTDSIFKKDDCFRLREIQFIPANWWSAQVIDSTSRLDLAEFADYLKMHPEIAIEIGTHTDARGFRGSNKKLSVKRAEAIRKVLVEEGIDSLRLYAMGYGEKVPAKVYLITENDFSLYKPDEGEIYVVTLRKIVINYYGNSNPVLTERLHQLNWRTDFRIVSVE